MRPRKHDRKLPSCVYHRHGSYYHVVGGRWHNLGRDLKAALAEYARRISAPTTGMAALINQAIPHLTRSVAPSTAAQYTHAAKRLSEIFAEFAPQDVLPRHVAQVRRELASTPNMTNRLLTVLRMVFDFALEQELVDSNPCVGIKRLAEGKRDRLLAAGEYAAIYAHAPDRLQVVIDLLRLTGQRVTDVLGIRRADLRDEGIYFQQRKTSTKLIVRWSPELRQVVERAKNLDKSLGALTLMHGRGGKPLDYRSVHDQWVRACAKAHVDDADLRDLRPMAATEAKKQGVDATALLGHASPAMTKRYLRDKEIPVVSGPSFGQMP